MSFTPSEVNLGFPRPSMATPIPTKTTSTAKAAHALTHPARRRVADPTIRAVKVTTY
jgi:hypothetical protein